MNASNGYTPKLYANIQVVLEGGLEAFKPTLGHRADGECLFYPGTTNGLVGEPESGKTLLALCVFADELFKGNSALIVDIDHNGAAPTVARLKSLGVSEKVLTDTSRFRYCAPEDTEELLAVVAEAKKWKPTAVLVDSVGEVLPMFGASSNSADEYTAVHRQVFTALANSGACVLLIDHLPKSGTAAEYGATGTIAKKRAIDGALYRVTVKQQFVPGAGGKASLSVLKDRHGSIRQISQQLGTKKEPLAATFHLKGGEATDWKFYPPSEIEGSNTSRTDLDVESLKALTPAPISVRDVRERLRWGAERASEALKLYRTSQVAEGAVPVPPLKGRGTGGTSQSLYLKEHKSTPQEQVHNEPTI